MSNVTQHLLDLADSLDQKGHLKAANCLDELIKTSSLDKVAQYVGVIGYVLKQNRAMANCIRKKRASSGDPMQKIVLSCLKEYQDGQDYNDRSWTKKYAEVISQKPTNFNNLHIALLREIGNKNKIAEHIDIVDRAAQELSRIGIKDDIINNVLSNLDELANIIRKEAGINPLPFKVASPATPYDELYSAPKRRSWWSRFFNPSEYNTWNPFSWSSKRRSKGKGMETNVEMDSLIQSLTNIQFITQRIKLNISQLKNQLADPAWLGLMSSKQTSEIVNIFKELNR